MARSIRPRPSSAILELEMDRSNPRGHSKQSRNRYCRFCNTAFAKTDHLKRHERIHTGEKPFTCKRCGRSYNRSDVLTRHIRGHLDGSHDGDSNENSGNKSTPLDNTSDRPDHDSFPSDDEGDKDEDQTHYNEIEAIISIPQMSSFDLSLGIDTEKPPNEVQLPIVAADNTHINASTSTMGKADADIRSIPHTTSQASFYPPIEFQDLLASAEGTSTPLLTRHRDGMHQSEPHDFTPEIAVHRHFDTGSRRSSPSWQKPSDEKNDTFNNLFQESSNYSDTIQPRVGRTAEISRDPTACMQVDVSLLDLVEARFPIFNSDNLDSAPLFHAPGSSSSISAKSLDQQVERSRSTESRAQIPSESFNYVQSIWPAPKQQCPCSSQKFWIDIATFQENSAFALMQPTGATEIFHDENVHKEYGWNEECRSRLYRYCQTVAISDFLDDNSLNHGHSTFRAGSETSEGIPPTFSNWIAFPEAKFLKKGLDLYFRKVHPMVPFIHRATFSASATSDSLLWSVCLLGLTFLEDSAVRSFVRQQMPGALERSRSELTSVSIRRSHFSQIICPLAAAVLLLHLSAMLPNVVQEDRLLLLHTESLKLAYRSGLFAVGSKYDIDPSLWRSLSKTDARWMAWSRVESLKRLIISMVLMDSFQASRFDVKPVINPESLSIALPCATELFEAMGSRRWNGLIASGVLETSLSFDMTNASLKLPTTLSKFGLQGILGAAWLKVLEAQSRLIPSFEKGYDKPSISPMDIYAQDVQAHNIVPFLLKIFVKYADNLGGIDVNNCILWNNICMHLCTHYELFEIAAGRDGAGRANSVLDYLAQTWVHTPVARRACLHAAQTFVMISRCKASDMIMFQSQMATFESALVLGIYMLLLPRASGQNTSGCQSSSGDDQYVQLHREQDEDDAFELLDDLDWNTIGSAGLLPYADMNSWSRSAEEGNLTHRFINHGGVVTFAGRLLRGGLQSTQSVFVEYMGLLEDIGKWNSRRLRHILRVLSVGMMEEGLSNQEHRLTQDDSMS